MKRIGIIILVMVLAIGAIGGTFARWSDIIEVDVEVDTGSWVAGIADNGTWGWTQDELLEATDYCFSNNCLTETMPGALFDFLYGSNCCDDLADGILAIPNCQTPPPISENLGDALFTEPGEYYTRIRETIEGAYPDYNTGTTISIANGGTIPIKLLGLETENLNTLGIENPFSAIQFWKAMEYDAEGVLVNTQCGHLWDSLNDFLGSPDGCCSEPYQLHAGNYLDIDIYFRFDVSNFNEELGGLSGNISWEWMIDWVPWNDHDSE